MFSTSTLCGPANDMYSVEARIAARNRSTTEKCPLFPFWGFFLLNGENYVTAKFTER